jgi:signal transduction histidine kinase
MAQAICWVTDARAAERRCAPVADGYGLALHLSPDAMPTPGLGDADRLLQAISNLLENAIRCPPAGGSIEMRTDGTALTVTDNGPGIRPEDLPRPSTASISSAAIASIGPWEPGSDWPLSSS